MDTLVTLNMAGYAAALAGGFIAGTLFGRKLVADFMAALHAVESRVTAVEAALGLHHAAPAAAPAPAHAAVAEAHAAPAKATSAEKPAAH